MASWASCGEDKEPRGNGADIGRRELGIGMDLRLVGGATPRSNQDRTRRGGGEEEAARGSAPPGRIRRLRRDEEDHRAGQDARGSAGKRNRETIERARSKAAWDPTRRKNRGDVASRTEPQFLGCLYRRIQTNPNGEFSLYQLFKRFLKL